MRLKAFAFIATTIASTIAAAPALHAQDTIATMNDPRASLSAGAKNTAAIAIKNMKLVSYTPKPAEFDSARGLSWINSDIAFKDHYVYQGNFSGFMIWDVANPAAPKLVSANVCATDQADPSIYGNLLFISAESGRARKDCGLQGVAAGEGADRMRGVRIYDVSNPAHPKLVNNVQTCRGTHTHTIVPDPKDKNVIYIYGGGSSSVRDSSEVESLHCSGGSYPENPNASQNRIDIIKVPLLHPEQAAVVGFARIFEDLPRSPGRAGVADTSTTTAVTRRTQQGDVPGGRRRSSGPGGCHDLTAYPAYNIVAGSCGSHGILLDVRDPMHPVRLDAETDVNFSLWHTAVFNNNATSVVYTDEWGGGTAPRCRVTDPQRLGGNTVLTIDNGKMTQHGYFKMLAAQGANENCVSHNGGLVPVPGRDIMVQGWYQGGVDVFDFSNPDHPFEIAYFDRGPVDEKLVTGGSWGAYYWNGYIYSSELSRGLDILQLQPSEFLSQNEIDAAKLAHLDQYNPQSQPRIHWPAAFPVVRSYLDQLVRDNGLAASRTSAIATALNSAEKARGAARKTALTKIAAGLDKDAAGAKDAAKVRTMAKAVRDLAAATK
jgi:hypothetical protein